MDTFLKTVATLYLAKGLLESVGSFVDYVYHKGYKDGMKDAEDIEKASHEIDEHEKQIKSNMKEAGIPQDHVDEFIAELHRQMESILED